jgi:hypothetical protein
MKKTGKMIFLILSVLIFAEFGCKKSQEAETQYVLTVQCASGVSGEPQSGSLNYTENSSVSYNYSAAAGYGNLQVILDGQAVAASGLVVMNMNHTLSAAAERKLYFQGNWQLNAQWTSQTCSLQNGSNLAASGSQNGDDITLTITGMNMIANGKIDLEGNFVLTAEVIYSNQSKFKFTFTGKMNGDNNFSGEVKAEGFLNDSPICTATGNFSANKI